MTMVDSNTFGKAALDSLHKGRTNAGPGLLFLDCDDVICVGEPYGGYDLIGNNRPDDLFDKLWHPPATQTLLRILEELAPQVVMTTSWLRFMERDGFDALFRRTGLELVANLLHPKWEAPADRGMSRHDSIQRWLLTNYASEPVVILDDELSGTGLRGSKLDRLECVVWCGVGVGLHDGHFQQVRRALSGGTT